MRWGELAGLSRDNLDLRKGVTRIDPRLGALHEVGGQLFLGPPKTPDSAREVHLPPFLTDLLAEVAASLPYPTVFCGARGSYQRRSNFNRHAWTPAISGSPQRRLPPIVSGMHFHDLRHTHRTWLIEDGIPEVVQARRLGHRLP